MFNATSIIPLHKHVIPSNVNENLTTFSVSTKIELFKFSIFPEITAYIIEIIINIGHNIFNIFSTPTLYLY